MRYPVTAVYDANILYPAPLRDLFIRLAQVGLVRARWTDAFTMNGCEAFLRTIQHYLPIGWLEHGS